MSRKVNKTKTQKQSISVSCAIFNYMGLKGAIRSVYMYALVVGQGHLHACTLLTLLRTWWGETEWV